MHGQFGFSTCINSIQFRISVDNCPEATLILHREKDHSKVNTCGGGGVCCGAIGSHHDRKEWNNRSSSNGRCTFYIQIGHPTINLLPAFSSSDRLFHLVVVIRRCAAIQTRAIARSRILYFRPANNHTTLTSPSPSISLSCSLTHIYHSQCGSCNFYFELPQDC